MTARNIRVDGHALKKPDPNNRYRWECHCGASGTALGNLTPTEGRRHEHDEHKIAVLRAQGKLEEE